MLTCFRSISRPRIGDQIKVSVKVTEKIESFFYLVFGRGELLVSGIQLVSSSTTIFEFCSKFDMVPDICLIVYYIRPDGEVVSDFLDIQLKRKLNNFVGPFYFSSIFNLLIK
jgi:hypothetical protein